MSNGGARRWGLIIILLVGVYSGATINNIASAPLSLIAADFDTSAAAITLVASASGFSLACCMPFAGWLGVRLGSRTVLVGSYALLGVGCLLAGLASSLWLLVVARVIQGIAMSVIPPTIMHTLPALMGEGLRARALAWWAVANGAGTASGAPLGALIADTIGWRMMFIVFVPICLLIALACLPLKPDAVRQGPLDVRSALLLPVALALVVAPTMVVGLGLQWGVLVGSVLVGVLVAVLFVRSLRRSATPFVAPDFLRSTRFLVGSLGGAVQMFVLGSVAVLVPLIIVDAYDLSVRLAGLFVLVVTATMMVSAPPVSALVRRIGAWPTILTGLVLVAGAVLAAAGTLSGGGSMGVVIGLLALAGMGLGLLQAPSAVVVSADHRARGSGLGLFNSIRFSAGVVGAGWLSMADQWGGSPQQALLAAGVPILVITVVVAVAGRSLGRT
ncbi:MAG: MFS transporter [Propionibacteriaceae bacterium]